MIRTVASSLQVHTMKDLPTRAPSSHIFCGRLWPFRDRHVQGIQSRRAWSTPCCTDPTRRFQLVDLSEDPRYSLEASGRGLASLGCATSMSGSDGMALLWLLVLLEAQVAD